MISPSSAPSTSPLGTSSCGQTISQPSIHARYLELLELKGQERVLEIGTGSGYQTVLLSHLVAQIFTIERIPAMYNLGRENIAKAGAKNVSMLLGDGTVGWREYSPYDAILVSAGGPSVPPALVGGLDEQTLKLVVRHGTDVRISDVAPVRFVPLFGTHGWEQQT